MQLTLFVLNCELVCPSSALLIHLINRSISLYPVVKLVIQFLFKRRLTETDRENKRSMWPAIISIGVTAAGVLINELVIFSKLVTTTICLIKLL